MPMLSNPNRFCPFFSRRQKRAPFHREPESVFVLEHSFLQHALQGDRRVDDIERSVGSAPDREFGHGFPVLEQSVVEDCPGDDERIFVFRSIEREVAELDLELRWISDRGVGRDEWPICGRR
jgi:hypothetical protein